MEQDLATLQVISETLKEDPHASQRTLAKKANMSLGMMNAILGRFVERGWIMLSNVNARKLAYAVTPEGIAELSERSKNFAKRTFKLASQYNEVLVNVIQKAKNEGKHKVILYGESYIKFLIVYACHKSGMEFYEKDVNSPIEESALCLYGELNTQQIHLLNKSCYNIVEILGGL